MLDKALLESLITQTQSIILEVDLELATTFLLKEVF
jgi:hypothetical protein